MADLTASIHRRLREFQGSPVGYGYQLRHVLSSLIVERLTELGWSQAKLAEVMGVSESFVSRLVHSGSNFQADVAGRVLHALELPPVIAPRTIVSETAAKPAKLITSYTGDTNHGETQNIQTSDTDDIFHTTGDTSGIIVACESRDDYGSV